MTIQKEYKTLLEHEKKLRERFKKLIQDLPEALPGVTRVAPNAAIVSLNTIKEHGFNLSPRYYLSMASKNALLEEIDRSTMDGVINKINAIIATGSIKTPGGTVKLHPEFIERLKGVWNA